jgi:hypothetical protein
MEQQLYPFDVTPITITGIVTENGSSSPLDINLKKAVLFNTARLPLGSQTV